MNPLPETNNAYYGQPAKVQDILNGSLKTEKSQPLIDLLTKHSQ